MVLRCPRIRSRRGHAPAGRQTVGSGGAAGSTETRLLLARAATAEQAKSVGVQAGGRVFLFLHTNDFWADFRAMQEKGVRFCEEPRQETYSTVAVFEDLYGNRWDLLQLKADPASE